MGPVGDPDLACQPEAGPLGLSSRAWPVPGEGQGEGRLSLLGAVAIIKSEVMERDTKPFARRSWVMFWSDSARERGVVCRESANPR